MNKAAIGRVRVRLHTREQYADALQQRCSDWFHARLQQALAALLTQVEGSGEVIAPVERLTVAVGDIPLSRFEAEMSERVIRRLKQLLQTGRSARTASTVTEGEMAAMTVHESHPEPAMPRASTATRPQGPADSFRQWLHYLDTGVVADVRHRADVKGREQWLTEALAHASRSLMTGSAGRENSPRIALALCLLRPQARRRLATAWSGPALARVNAWLVAPHRLPPPPPAGEAPFILLAALIALQARSSAGAGRVARRTSSSSPAVQWGGLQQGHGRRRDASRAPLSPGPAGVTGTQGRTPAIGREADAMMGEGPAPSLGAGVLECWLDVVLRTALPASQRVQLQDWLQAFPAVTVCLSVPMQRRLRAAVDGTLPRAARETPRQSVVPDEGAGQSAGSDRLPRAVPPSSETRRYPGGTDGRAGTPAGAPSPGLIRSQGIDADDVWAVPNAGLALLWPLLPSLFGAFGWLNEGAFVDDDARWQAVAALDWLAWGDMALAEWRVPCARLLCGVPWAAPFAAQPAGIERQTELDTWLSQVFAAVPRLGRCGPDALRALFLQRPGSLAVEPRLKLTVEPDAADVLLYDLPWPLTQMALPWLDTPIGVDWTS
ncbi:hypothetical protein KH388_22220 [Serratia rubidaea]|nr:hypothetical protein [Serratia rubidaea]